MTSWRLDRIMATAKDLQALLRFLTQDARIPLATAISKAKGLQEAKLLKYGNMQSD